MHKWGQIHQVEFEASKESLHILCSKYPKGDNFKILGITFDTKLVMYDAVVSIVGEVGARINMLMRVRVFYSKSDMVSLYKSHILPFIESGTAAYYHAHPSILEIID